MGIVSELVMISKMSKSLDRLTSAELRSSEIRFAAYPIETRALTHFELLRADVDALAAQLARRRALGLKDARAA
ncbi:MAG: hypothetical protein N2444_00125 [Methylocystis sp.]|nr:hypothetical protein [Methylocystis sp.]